jgi:hypothetical protein
MASKSGGVKVLHRSSASGGGKGDPNGSILEAAAGLSPQEQIAALQQEKAALQRTLTRAEQVRPGACRMRPLSCWQTTPSRRMRCRAMTWQSCADGAPARPPRGAPMRAHVNAAFQMDARPSARPAPQDRERLQDEVRLHKQGCVRAEDQVRKHVRDAEGAAAARLRLEDANRRLLEELRWGCLAGAGPGRGALGPHVSQGDGGPERACARAGARSQPRMRPFPAAG